MAIADVIRLKQLRDQLFKFDWHAANSLDSIEFTTKRDNCYETQTLSSQEKGDLDKVLGIRCFPEAGEQSLSQTIGYAIRTIVLDRLDLAIKKAAIDARDEAREVLKILEEE